MKMSRFNKVLNESFGALAVEMDDIAVCVAMAIFVVWRCEGVEGVGEFPGIEAVYYTRGEKLEVISGG